MAVVIDGSNTPTAGGVVYGDGTEYASTAAGSAGQVLLSNGSSAPTWGTAGTSTTATNLAGGSAGTVPYQSASGTTQMLAAGTSGQVLTSSGAGAPTWATPSAGAMVLISTLTASTSASLSWTGLTTYDRYFLIFENIYCTSAGRIEIQVGTGAGPTYVATGYYTASVSNNSNDPVTVNGSGVANGSATCVSLTRNPVSTSGLSGFCYITNMLNGNNTSFNFSTCSYTSATIYASVTGNAFLHNNTTTKTAIRVINIDGGLNLSAGKVTLYGITS